MPRKDNGGYSAYWTLNLPIELAIWCDNWCKEYDETRSALVKKLLKAFMDKEKMAKGDREYKAARAKKEESVEQKDLEAEANELLGLKEPAAAPQKGDEKP